MIVSVRKRRAPSRMTKTLTPQSQSSVARTPVRFPANGRAEVTFPDGLLGFPNCRRFTLSGYEPEDGSPSPFLTLQCQDEDLSFPLLDPRRLVTDYQFTLAPDVLTYLKANAAGELSILAIVTVRDRVEDTTMNLRGPLLINVHTQCGLQLVLEHFPLRYPLFVPGEHHLVAAK
jgi:flagellar assembly factor FliW